MTKKPDNIDPKAFFKDPNVQREWLTGVTAKYEVAARVIQGGFVKGNIADVWWPLYDLPLVRFIEDIAVSGLTPELRRDAEALLGRIRRWPVELPAKHKGRSAKRMRELLSTVWG